jgi:hypothetical protein
MGSSSEIITGTVQRRPRSGVELFDALIDELPA